MQVDIFNTPEEAAEYALTLFEQTLAQGGRVFGLATGSTPIPLYQLLSQSDLDFSEAIAINLDEYFSLKASDPQSYHHYMQQHLFNQKPFKISYIPDGANQDVAGEIHRYNEILANNPIDLQLLGIGVNAHIGFNEPGSAFDSQTRLVDLHPSTVQANERFFESATDVPTQAYSMGIGSIMQAKKIILMAFGENKAQAIYDTVKGPVTEEVPASILQRHPDVVILLDHGAAHLLNS